ncbi:prephenate dehydrogenase family protein [Actinidia rufa]|uniref:Prephenate dehydrogenase family protein n=1 Tax=Actinidia rufa TaxID=165716 RepID=A0A7J0DT98_9ERIC|nr:prephenate dehydrogenase family protein [Actinidia rufa]
MDKGGPTPTRNRKFACGFKNTRFVNPLSLSLSLYTQHVYTSPCPLSPLSGRQTAAQHHRLSLSPPPPPPSRLPLRPPNPDRRRRHRLKILALDAAQPFDYETRISDRLHKSTKLKIAVIGFGNFGQFLAKTLIRQGHTVLAHSRSDYSDDAANLGATFFSNADDLCEEHPEVILLCTSIISTEKVLRSLPLQRLKRSTLFVDVLSVKEFPKSLFMQILPVDFDILCTHPMFGPESGKNGWNGLTFVYDKARIGDEESRVLRCQRFLDVFAKEGCRMVEMSCAEHDRYAAGSQFITHTMGRVLEKLRLESTPVNTKGYETLLNLVENTASDSFDLYYGLFMYNKNAMEQLERLDLAFESLKKELFGHLHDVLRKQLFGKAEGLEILEERPVLSKLPPNGAALPPPSDSVGAQNN